MVISGAELKTKLGHENCGAKDEDMYEFELTGGFLKDSVTPKSRAKYIKTEEDIQAQADRVRADELRRLITDKKLLDEPCTADQDELRQLLGL